MPNNIQNRLQVIGTSEQINTVLNFLNGENGIVDFNRITPQPENIFLDNLGDDDRSVCKLLGRPNWYDWNRENWGTKWNAYQLNDERDTFDTVHFQTAWSAPKDFMYKLSTVFPAVKFKFSWADEDTGSNCGDLLIKNGDIIDGMVPINQSKEAYEICFSLHPDERQRYKLVGDRYEYDEDSE